LRTSDSRPDRRGDARPLAELGDRAAPELFRRSPHDNEHRSLERLEPVELAASSAWIVGGIASCVLGVSTSIATICSTNSGCLGGFADLAPRPAAAIRQRARRAASAIPLQ
jgi:hypothetical protein